MNHEARPHMPLQVEASDFANIKPAKPADFERCNTCRYVFAKREATIDMNDFRRHKQLHA